MRSIYHEKESGDYLLRKSFCAYMDILGFSNKIVENDLIFFNTYLSVLQKELEYLNEMHDFSDKEGFKSFELKIFTDNFVFGHPWYDKYGESELGNIFDALSHIQFSFAKANIFIRGAISISDLFMDSNVVLGPGIIESYKLESEKAIYPRIILSEKVLEVVREHIGYYAIKQSAPQSKEYLIDIDGFCFINYLLIVLRDGYSDDKYIINEISQHRDVVSRNLELHRDNFKVFEKYAWIANYHNYFCDNFVLNKYPSIKEIDVKVGSEKYSKVISRVV